MGGAFRVLVQKEWAPNPCVRTAVCSESSCKGIGALSPCAKRGGPSESSCKVNMSPQSSCKEDGAFGVLVQKECAFHPRARRAALWILVQRNGCSPRSCKALPSESSCKTNPCPPSSCKKAAFRTLVQNEPPILVQRGRCLQNPRAKRPPLQKRAAPSESSCKTHHGDSISVPNPRANPIAVTP